MNASVIHLYPVRCGDRVSIEGVATGYVLSLIRSAGRPLRARVPADDGITYVVPVDRLTLEPREPTAC
jgi:hypothetical protein